MSKRPWTGKPSEADYAAQGRQLIRRARAAMLSTALASKNGWPYGSLVSVALDCDGSPLMLFSTLSDHTRNLAKDSRASLLFEETSRLKNPQTGPRITVTGRVLGEDGGAIPGTLVEIWQCNAAGRYVHGADQHDAPLDPNFFGAGRFLTDTEGRYRFTSIRPGSYPWRNHPKAFRPAHIHFSLFGPCVLTRLVTQMYFPGDPLLPLDPIFLGIPDAAARERLVATYSLEVTEAEWALGYEFDIILRGRNATPVEQG